MKMMLMLLLVSTTVLWGCGDSQLVDNGTTMQPEPLPQPEPQPEPEPLPQPEPDPELIPNPELDAALSEQHVNITSVPGGTMIDVILRQDHSFYFIDNDAVTGNNNVTRGTWEAFNGGVMATYTIDGVDYEEFISLTNGIELGGDVNNADNAGVIVEVTAVRLYSMFGASDHTWVEYINDHWVMTNWRN